MNRHDYFLQHTAVTVTVRIEAVYRAVYIRNEMHRPSDLCTQNDLFARRPRGPRQSRGARIACMRGRRSRNEMAPAHSADLLTKVCDGWPQPAITGMSGTRTQVTNLCALVQPKSLSMPSGRFEQLTAYATKRRTHPSSDRRQFRTPQQTLRYLLRNSLRILARVKTPGLTARKTAWERSRYA